MYYSSLILRNFRSYDNYAIELSPSVNIVVGPNASGKTNLLEAVLYVSSGSSFRAKERDLLMYDQDSFKVEAETGEGVTRTIVVKQSPVADKVITIDDKKYKKLSQKQSIPVTLFEPEHMRMVHGSPERRREYLDGILKQTIPGYRKFLRDYKRVLAQRNKLLKSNRPIQKDELFVWDLKISELGAYIVDHRQKLVDQINKDTSRIYSQLSGKDQSLLLEYSATIVANDYASVALKALQERFDQDKLIGYTTIGPHRDDISFVLNDHPALTTASRGETRTIVLACKLIELLILEQARDQSPILLLDDVFSELDSARRRYLTDYLERYQTIITTTDADAIIKHFMGEYKVIPTSTTQ